MTQSEYAGRGLQREVERCVGCWKLCLTLLDRCVGETTRQTPIPFRKVSVGLQQLGVASCQLRSTSRVSNCAYVAVCGQQGEEQAVEKLLIAFSLSQTTFELSLHFSIPSKGLTPSSLVRMPVHHNHVEGGGYPCPQRSLRQRSSTIKRDSVD